MNSLNLFRNEIKDSLLFHIPHSSLQLPNTNGFLLSKEELDLENLISCDVSIDEIFHIEDITTIKYPISRLFCDVEKLPINEEMDKFGRGIYYTKSIDGLELRNFDYSQYWNILTNYYIPHHNNIIDKIENILLNSSVVRIIDAHSFNGFDVENPDICIGIDEFHTPQYLIDHVVLFFKNNGFNVEINFPYSGTYVPLKYYHKNKNIEGIMIEINKRLYCGEDYNPIKERVKELNQLIVNLFDF